MIPRAHAFPIGAPAGDDAQLHAAWHYANQKWQREVAAIDAWCKDPCNATLKAMEHSEFMTAGAVQQLFDEHRNAARRAAERPTAA